MEQYVLTVYLLITLIPTIVYQLFFFSIAWWFKFDKVTDLAGGTGFVLLAIFTLVLRTLSAGDDSYIKIPTRNVVASILVIVWGCRLSGFLFWRILKTGRDTRFDNMREKFWSFLGFWILQMIWVWVVSLPVTILNSPSYASWSKFGTPLDITGTVIFTIGLLTESIADIQKWKFRSRTPCDQPNWQYPFIQSGLFRYSRHPNYFGEIFLWIGIYLLCLRRDLAQILTIVSPLLTAFLLMFVSGLPLNEKPVARKRYNPAEKDGGECYRKYSAYLKRTSILIPLPPLVYLKLPQWVKSTILLDFGIYQFDPVKEGMAIAVDGAFTNPDEDHQGESMEDERRDSYPSDPPVVVS